MAKKTKPEEKELSQGAAPIAETNNGRAVLKRPPKKTKKPTAGKAGGTIRKRKLRNAAAAIEPTDEEVRLRAYFISERRHRLALAGDASSDWLEAKRQLLSELGPR